MKNIIIAGPTAVGKTKLSLEVASKLGAHIINCDSRQIYKGMSVGTAKPTADELAVVPHHLIDCAELSLPWSVAKFVEETHKIIRDLHSKSIPVVLSGGTGLYLQKVLYGLDEIPATEPEVRQKLADQMLDLGLDALYERLQNVDAKAAQKIKAGDTQRILRALEVFEQTGQPISSFWKQNQQPLFEFKLHVLNCDRSKLYERINQRVLTMMEQGLKQEAQGLWNQYPTSDVLSKTIGYSEWPEFEWQDELVVQKIQQNSRHFAKRQLTWFRGMADVNWIETDSHKTIQDLVRCVIS